MKPWGMTSAFQIIRPGPVEDKVWDAVDEAIRSGWTPNQFIQETRECWAEAIRQQAKDSEDDFKKALSR